MEQLLLLARASRPIPTAGGLLFTADLPGHPQPYLLKSPRAWPERLTASTERTVPVGETELGLLLTYDSGGNEAWQLDILERDSGTRRRLTHDPKAIHRSVVIAPDGRRAGLSHNPGGQDDFRLGVIDLATGAIEDWLAEPGYWLWEGWSPDGRTAAVSRSLSGTKNLAYLLGEGGDLRPVLPRARRVEQIAWAGERLLAVTDLDSEFLGVAEVDPSAPDEPLHWILQPEADVLAVLVAPDPARAVVGVNRGPFDELALLDVESGSIEPITELPPGLVSPDNVSAYVDQLAWAPDGSLFVAWETPTQPAEIYQLTLDGREPVRWTEASSPPGGLRQPVQAEFRTFDGLRVPALHYRVDGRPRPTVVWFHGGPESQLRGGFSPLFQALNRAGFDVFAPNVRGSTGYGVHYFSLDDRELRWDSVRDGCEAGRHLKREGYATALAPMGGSYGGFMTLAVLVEDPDLWDAAVEIVGIADWRTFFANTSGWRRAVRAAEYGDPETADAEFLEEFSPLRRAHSIKAPLLVLHGRNDVRVPVGEAEQIAAAAADVELLIFDDEGHGLAKHGNRVRGYGRAIEFLTERLGGGA
ncbi:MAG TPA: prolyl oligopeptidase family serine peptidase [Candidatus Dormibacteraeota bacterium]